MPFRDPTQPNSEIDPVTTHLTEIQTHNETIATDDDVTIEITEGGDGRTIHESATYATGAIPAVAHLFTLRETAEIISKSYHTTRNMALRGAFGALLRNTDDDDTAYVHRRGLLEYLRLEMEKHIDEAVSFRVTRARLTDPAVDQIVDPEIEARSAVERQVFDDDGNPILDTIDEQTNLAQAFENVAQAFSALNVSFDGMHDEFDEARRHSETRDLDIVQRINRLDNRSVAATEISNIHSAILEIRHTLVSMNRANERETPNFRAYVNVIDIQYDENVRKFHLRDRTVATRIFDIEADDIYLTDNAMEEIMRRRSALSWTSSGGTFQEIPPHLLSTSQPAFGHRRSESTPTPFPDASLPTVIANDRPDRIVTVRVNSSLAGVDDPVLLTEFRTRLALSQGQPVYVDETGDIRPVTREMDLIPLGVVSRIRDAIPDASEQIQPVQRLEMLANDRVEILHPYRNLTCVVTTNQTGVPTFADTAHFVLVGFDIVVDEREHRRVSIQWRAS
jgi:hypothetical protein